jgi:hypothetical protein
MELILITLATWRVSSLLVFEDGPFLLLMKMRSLIGVYYDEYSEPQGNNVFARALTCVWCSSIWVALVFTVLYYFGLAFWIAMPFALSAVAIIIERIVDGSRE